jgi:hypothetical protein
MKKERTEHRQNLTNHLDGMTDEMTPQHILLYKLTGRQEL